MTDGLEIRVALTELAVHNVDEKLDQHMADTKMAREELREFLNIRLQPLEDINKILTKWRMLAVMLLILGGAIYASVEYLYYLKTLVRTKLGI